ncbi:DUF4279 domain-containing protein [Pelagicoccus sp. NFK12]|uniref:DUF4279 domain-containing protein n=1 Tax=Pelagicoccus enzymogenes TaxID=2773457 RepID=A0A927F8E6_9BACT|nr:DUF4279 domain-containing protein [Pelagicoccus enzymogenes]MBD5779815.1 DUF4279 domain-containing protein [Pelagicoccus enzymogenes]
MDTNEEIVSSVTLIILGNDLEPSTVSELLDLKPSRSWKRGEEKPLARSTFYDWGGWKRLSPDTNDSVEEKIRFWIGVLEGKEKAFEKIKDNGWRASLDVFYAFTECSTFSVSNDLSKKIGELNLELDFTLHSEERGANQSLQTTSASRRV